MGSVFPGMDPYIEGQEWSDFHHHFIEDMHASLVAQLRPRYVVRVERRVYVEHHPEETPEHFRPDVTVLAEQAAASRSTRAEQGAAGVAVAPVVLHVPMPERVREAFLTIRPRGAEEVVAIIELLSPANKRRGADGRREYLEKREAVLESDTHLIELDLLRGGERLPTVEPLPPGDYYALVCRGKRRPRAEVYAWSLRRPLPPVPVPLAHKDPDASLDLGALFTSAYDRAGYDYSLDYRRRPDPPLSEADAAWARPLLPGE
jgi:hypothetical protein